MSSIISADQINNSKVKEAEGGGFFPSDRPIVRLPLGEVEVTVSQLEMNGEEVFRINQESCSPDSWVTAWLTACHF